MFYSKANINYYIMNIKLWTDFHELSIIPVENRDFFTLNSIKIEAYFLYQEQNRG